MSSKNLTVEERTERIKKRAGWESFAFAVPTARKVNVQNFSHGEEEVGEHSYTVSVDAGVTIECTLSCGRASPREV